MQRVLSGFGHLLIGRPAPAPAKLSSSQGRDNCAVKFDLANILKSIYLVNRICLNLHPPQTSNQGATACPRKSQWMC